MKQIYYGHIYFLHILSIRCHFHFHNHQIVSRRFKKRILDSARTQKMERERERTVQKEEEGAGEGSNFQNISSEKK